VRRSLVVWALLWAPAALAAPPDKRAAVVEVVTEGLSAAARDRLDEALVNGLRFTGYVVVSRRTAHEQIAKQNLPDGCAFGPCLTKVGTALDVGRVLTARVGADGQAYSYVLTLVETRLGTPVGQVVDACAPCSIDEVLDKISSSMVALGEQAGGRALKRAPFPEARRTGQSIGPWMVGAGLAALVVGAILVANSEPRDAGLVTIGGGSGLLASGILVWALD
jgi:hypothetical protein